MTIYLVVDDFPYSHTVLSVWDSKEKAELELRKYTSDNRRVYMDIEEWEVNQEPEKRY